MTILRGKEIGESGGSRGEGQKNLRGVGDGGKGEGYIYKGGGETKQTVLSLLSFSKVYT